MPRRYNIQFFIFTVLIFAHARFVSQYVVIDFFYFTFLHFFFYFISESVLEASNDSRYNECLDEEYFLASSNCHLGVQHLQDLVYNVNYKGFPQSEDKSTTESVPDTNASIPSIYEQLKSFIAEDVCQDDYHPVTLLSSVSPVNSVKERESSLLDSFNNLQTTYPDFIQQLSCFFRYHAASIEMERMNAIGCCTSQSMKDYMNHHFDAQILKIMDRVEQSLCNLSSMNISSSSQTRSRPAISRRSLTILEEWYHLHLEHPYPTASQVELLATRSKLTTEQVKKWFGNKRSRSKNTKSLTEIAKVKRRQRLFKRC